MDGWVAAVAASPPAGAVAACSCGPLSPAAAVHVSVVANLYVAAIGAVVAEHVAAAAAGTVLRDSVQPEQGRPTLG